MLWHVCTQPYTSQTTHTHIQRWKSLKRKYVKNKMFRCKNKKGKKILQSPFKVFLRNEYILSWSPSVSTKWTGISRHSSQRTLKDSALSSPPSSLEPSSFSYYKPTQIHPTSNEVYRFARLSVSGSKFLCMLHSTSQAFHGLFIQCSLNVVWCSMNLRRS